MTTKPPSDTSRTTDRTPTNDASAGLSPDVLARISLDATQANLLARSATEKNPGTGTAEANNIVVVDPATGKPQYMNVDPSANNLYRLCSITSKDLFRRIGLAPNGTDDAQRQAVDRDWSHPREHQAPAAPAEANSMARDTEIARAGTNPSTDRTENGTKIKDSSDRSLDAATSQAREKFLDQMKRRLTEGDYAELVKRLDQMDQRILNNKVKDRSGRFVDQQQELKDTYDALSKLADGKAESSDGLKYDGQNVYTREDVNKIMADTVTKLANPEHTFNQGQHNTCALQAAARQEAAISPSTFVQRQAEIACDGQFQAGNKIVKLDIASLRLDAEARNHGLWEQGDWRGAAGHNNDIAMAQLHLNQEHGVDNNGKGKKVYTQKFSAVGHGDTGERILDARSGEEIGRGPDINASSLSSVKQAAFGNRFSDTFGKDTTFVNQAAFGRLAGVSSFTSAEEMKTRLKENENKGWLYSTIGMHTGHWRGTEGQGGAGGWHAVSISMADGEKINVINNWGGYLNFTGAKAQDAATVLHWMNDTDNKPGTNYIPGDHDFDPNSQTRITPDQLNPELRDLNDDVDNKNQEEEEEDNDKQARSNDKEQRQLQLAQATIQHLKEELDQLSPENPRRDELLARLIHAENLVAGIRGEQLS